MAEGDIELIITLADGEVVKGLARAEAQAVKSGARVERSMSDGFSKGFSMLNRQILGMAATFAAAFAGRKIIAAAAGQEAAIAKVNQSMIAAGSYSAAASASMIALADNIQKTTTVSDDAALSALALARNYTTTNEQAQALTKAALDLSSATGDTLESAVDKLGKTYSGTADRLGKVIPALQGLTEEQLRAGAAVDIVAKKFKGFAEAEALTFAGSMKQAANRFDELLEGLGNLIIKSPAIAAAFRFVSKAFEKLTAGMGAIQGDPFKNILTGAADVARFFTSILGPIIEFIVNRFVIFGKTLGALGASIAQLMSGQFKEAALTFKDGVIGEFFDMEKTFDMSGTNSALAFIDGFKVAIETAPPLSKPLKDQANEIKAAIDGISFDSVANAFSATANRIAYTAVDLAKILRDNLLTGFTNAFAAIGGALVKGENAFAAFGKAILSSLGQLLIQFGGMLVTIGVGLSTVPFLFGLQGPAAVAAGIAAIVAGGALMALGGGGGAKAPAGGGGISSGGMAGGESPVTAGVAETQKRGPEVQVVVQGNIMDRRQTGLELADVIREAFDGNAVVFT